MNGSKLLVLVAFVLFLIAGLILVFDASFDWRPFIAFGLASWSASGLVP